MPHGITGLERVKKLLVKSTREIILTKILYRGSA
jgi:hypothetical protein